MSSNMRLALVMAYLLIGVFVAALVTEPDERDGWLVVLVAIWPIVVLFLAIVYLMAGTVWLADSIKKLVRSRQPR